MAKVIALVGSKGGSGKSTAAHLIGHGCGSLAHPIPCVVLTTDPEEHPLTDLRRYRVADARRKDQLLELMKRFLDVERLLIVLDGAAARPELDAIVTGVADIALLPFRAAAQDAERAAANLERLPSAIALPMGWPKHPGVAKRARKWLDLVPESRRLAPLPHMPRLDGLFSPEGYVAATYEISAPARGLALEVLARGGVDAAELEVRGG